MSYKENQILWRKQADMTAYYGVCATSNGVIAETSDSGNTWKTLYSNSSYKFSSNTMTDPTTIVAGGNAIVKSSDRGLNWNVAYSGASINDIKFIDKQTGFAAAGNNVLKTTDGGSTWHVSYHATLIKFESLCIIDDQTVVSAGYQKGPDPSIKYGYYIKDYHPRELKIYSSPSLMKPKGYR
jgi:photosystem II stability/assembly factor-like uncharacterized protein